MPPQKSPKENMPQIKKKIHVSKRRVGAYRKIISNIKEKTGNNNLHRINGEIYISFFDSLSNLKGFKKAPPPHSFQNVLLTIDKAKAN